MNQARSEEEGKERKRDRKDRGQEADGKKCKQQNKNTSEEQKQGLPGHSSGKQGLPGHSSGKQSRGRNSQKNINILLLYYKSITDDHTITFLRFNEKY